MRVVRGVVLVIGCMFLFGCETRLDRDCFSEAGCKAHEGVFEDHVFAEPRGIYPAGTFFAEGVAKLWKQGREVLATLSKSAASVRWNEPLPPSRSER